MVFGTPNLPIASVLSSLFFGVWNLFTGFLIGHQVPHSLAFEPPAAWEGVLRE